MSIDLSQALSESGFLNKKLVITENDYKDAIDSLIELALDETGGSRAAAQVLLSTYKGNSYHVDLTDLCVFDYNYLEKALIVIKGRSMLSMNPSDAVHNGHQRFKKLEMHWKCLHVNERYLR